ncbi:MAG: YqzL family protein [Bacillus sp. (in: firmicutes)]
MLDFTWNIFKETGNVDTYLLFKEIQSDSQASFESNDDELAEMNSTLL